MTRVDMMKVPNTCSDGAAAGNDSTAATTAGPPWAGLVGALCTWLVGTLCAGLVGALLATPLTVGFFGEGYD